MVMMFSYIKERFLKQPQLLPLVGSLIVFTPFFMKLELLPQVNAASPIAKAFESNTYLYSVVASLAISAPILLDYLLDILSPKRFQMSLNPQRDIIIALVLPDLLLLGYVIPNRLYSCSYLITKARELFYVYSVLDLLIKMPQPIFTNVSVSPIALFFTAANIVGAFSAYTDPSTYFVLDNLQLALDVIAFLSVIILFYRWYKHLQSSDNMLETSRVYQCNVYVISIFSFGVLAWILSACTNHDTWTGTDDVYLATYMYFVCIASLMVSVLNSRIVKAQSSEMERSLEIRKMFIRYISHEIRTPLNTVFLGLKLLRKDILMSKISRSCKFKLLRTVKDVRVSCHISLEILNDLLTYDKLESGLMQLELKLVPPWPFMRSTIAPFQVQARQAGVQLVILDLDDIPRRFFRRGVKADVHKLSQVVRNLISNAIKFTPKGGTVTVDLQLMRKEIDSVTHSNRRRSSGLNLLTNIRDVKISEAQSDRLVLKVIDTGAGISTENQTKLFKSVVQFNPGKLQKGGGSGLGLYITKGIVDLHGGSISVFSEGEGHGSTFSLELPLVEVAAESTEEEKSDDDSSTGYSEDKDDEGKIDEEPSVMVTSFKSDFNDQTPNPDLVHDFSTSEVDPASSPTPPTALNILVVDDSQLNRRMMLRLLQSRGDRCVEAEDGSQAVALVQQCLQSGKKLDAVLTDRSMPVMGGVEATRKMREMGFKGLVVGITGDAMDCDMSDFLDAGANHVLSKPLDEVLLFRILSDLAKLKKPSTRCSERPRSMLIPEEEKSRSKRSVHVES